MQRHHAEPYGHRLLQCGDVAVPEEHRGLGTPQRRPIDVVDHPLRSVPAAHADDRPDVRGRPRRGEVLGATLVGAGQVVVARMHVANVGHLTHLQAPRPQDRDAGIEAVRWHGARRRDEGDEIAFAESAGPHSGGERFRGWRRHRPILPNASG